jgi:hypothetical protein
MAAETVSNLVFTGPLTWTSEASCHGQSRLFFAPPGERPEAGPREANARVVCRTCDVCASAASGRGNREYGFGVAS